MPICQILFSAFPSQFQKGKNYAKIEYSYLNHSWIINNYPVFRNFGFINDYIVLEFKHFNLIIKILTDNFLVSSEVHFKLYKV